MINKEGRQPIKVMDMMAGY